MMVTAVNRFPEIAARLKPAAKQGVKAAAKTMVANCQQGAARRTGFMAGNVYMSAWDESTYGQGPAPPTDDVYLLPEVKPPDDTSAIVGAAANYSIYNELGTRFQPPHPWFYPGVEQTRSTFEADVALVIRNGLTL